MTATTQDAPSAPLVVTIPLRSDPAWLGRGVLAVNLLCVLLFALYFRSLSAPRPPIGLSLIPGLAVGTFAGAAFAWWSRRRNGTMQLEAKGTRLVLVEPERRSELVDRADVFGAMLVCDKAASRRILVLSQRGEPNLLLDMGHNAAAAGEWAGRTITADLSDVAVSPASAHVLTTRVGTSLDPLLDALAKDLSQDAPLLRYPLPSGETLVVRREEVRVGSRTFPIAGTTAKRLVVGTPQGDVAGISLVHGDEAALVCAMDPGNVSDPRAESDSPDVYLPPVLFAVVAQLFGLETGARTVTSRPYRG